MQVEGSWSPVVDVLWSFPAGIGGPSVFCLSFPVYEEHTV